MAWTAPTLVEICIGLEINGYLLGRVLSKASSPDERSEIRDAPD
jgi:coenzyme PQQ precursor peptide PqqA